MRCRKRRYEALWRECFLRFAGFGAVGSDFAGFDAVGSYFDFAGFDAVGSDFDFADFDAVGSYFGFADFDAVGYDLTLSFIILCKKILFILKE